MPGSLWERGEPLLPKVERRSRYPGRKRIDDRRCCAGSCSCCIPGSDGSSCPPELGFGSGMTCWRRLRDWHEARVWARLHQELPAELHAPAIWTGPGR
ncbi:transposase [Actinomadura napierensis]|uniref:transposase n=1 Tax=Actinomadura napierensis TaxID=267854 RepID=UPI00387ECA01